MQRCRLSVPCPQKLHSYHLLSSVYCIGTGNMGETKQMCTRPSGDYRPLRDINKIITKTCVSTTGVRAVTTRECSEHRREVIEKLP